MWIELMRQENTVSYNELLFDAVEINIPCASFLSSKREATIKITT
jgi:hypothetical protein